MPALTAQEFVHRDYSASLGTERLLDLYENMLLSRKLEHSGKIPLLLSLDKVKLRRPVVPGDQLILESENIRVKARTGHGPFLVGSRP